MELQGSRTQVNLMAAFAGESQARNRYTYAAAAARKEGFVQIADIFEETADQEKEHAKRLFKFMTGGEAAITGSFPFGVIGSTIDNLKAAAAGENHEHTCMYPEFAAIADEEGFGIIAGNPARLIRPRFEEDVIEALLKIAWWDWPPDKVTRNLKAIVGCDLELLCKAT